MTAMQAFQAQHAILCFTLGGLIGAPVGWFLGWATDENRLWRQLVATMISMFALDREVTAFMLHMTVRYPQLKEQPA